MVVKVCELIIGDNQNGFVSSWKNIVNSHRKIIMDIYGAIVDHPADQLSKKMYQEAFGEVYQRQQCRALS